MLKRKGAIDDDENDPLLGLSRFALSAGRRTKDDDDDADPGLPPQGAAMLVVGASGSNLDAIRTVKEGDFDARERLCRYLLRAPLALERPSIDENVNARYALRKPDHHGHTAIVMTPHELLGRLSALIPAPRLCLRQPFGVLTPSIQSQETHLPRSRAYPSPLIDDGRSPRRHEHPGRN